MPQFATGVLLVPLANVGAGPALNITLAVRPTADDGSDRAAVPGCWYEGTYSALGIGEVAMVRIEVDRLADLPSYRFRATYADVASLPLVDWRPILPHAARPGAGFGRDRAPLITEPTGPSV